MQLFEVKKFKIGSLLSKSNDGLLADSSCECTLNDGGNINEGFYACKHFKINII